MSLHIYGGPAAAKKDRTTDPIDFLRQIRNENLKLSHAAMRKVFVEAARNEPDCIDAALEYYFDNHLKALDRLDAKEQQTLDVEPVKRQRTKIEKQIVKKYVQKAYSIMLENVRLAVTGKLLLESTFADCAKEGGWLTRLAAKGKPREIVGKKLTKAQILALIPK